VIAQILTENALLTSVSRSSVRLATIATTTLIARSASLVQEIASTAAAPPSGGPNESIGRSRVDEIVIPQPVPFDSIGISRVDQVPGARTYSAAIASLAGTAAMNALTVGSNNYVYPGFMFRFRGRSPYSNVNIVMKPESEVALNTSVGQPKIFLDWLDFPGYREPGAVWEGSLSPGTHTVRWEGGAAAPYTAPPDLVWELTIFDDGVMQIVTGPIIGDGLSELEFIRGTPPYGTVHLPVPLAANSSIVLIPVNDNYVALVGSYT
jgi:hypothetical protein